MSGVRGFTVHYNHYINFYLLLLSNIIERGTLMSMIWEVKKYDRAVKIQQTKYLYVVLTSPQSSLRTGEI